MLDIDLICNNTELVRENTRERFTEADIDKTIQLYVMLKDERGHLQELQRQQNQITAEFQKADGTKQDDLKDRSTELKTQILAVKRQIEVLEQQYVGEMLRIPNLTAEGVPNGKDDTANVPIKYHGTKPVFDFPCKTHLDLGATLDLIEFEKAAKITGAKFYFLKNEAVLLEFALIRFAIDTVMRNGFTPVTTPDLARDTMITAAGFTPRGPESQIYSLTDGDVSLIGTSEITIGGLLANEVINEENLPIKIAGISHCFRTEAGSHGKENKGLFRVHQFTKVEMYQFCHPDNSNQALEEMLAIEEGIYKALNLPYRVVLICKGDLGAPAYKKYDIEAWMPFLGKNGGYGEVTSVSNCTDFQARRLNARFRNTNTKKNGFVHTLNGTAIAITRTLLAILENGQQKDGTVVIPEVLRPYTGIDVIQPKKRNF
jgi:seryl-tRNA synthetase